MRDAGVTDDELAALVERVEEAAAAYLRGDVDRYLAPVHYAPGFTLGRPTGEPGERFDDRAEDVRASAGYFQAGEAKLEVVQAHAWDDTVVLAMIERQHGRMGGLPDQDLSLRVTAVYRRDGADWKLVHRHADPLVEPISPEQAAALTRG